RLRGARLLRSHASRRCARPPRDALVRRSRAALDPDQADRARLLDAPARRLPVRGHRGRRLRRRHRQRARLRHRCAALRRRAQGAARARGAAVRAAARRLRGAGAARVSGAAARAARIRNAAGWFALPDRGLIRVRGADGVRWANGMVSNDVARLAPGPARSGCHALLLTAQGRIVADLHVLAREDELWFELARSALPAVLKRLERYVIADDVALSDASDGWRRFALEGPRAPERLARAAGAELAIAPDCGAELQIAGATAIACAWGSSGEAAYQIFAPSEASDAIARAFEAAGGAALEPGDAETLEVLRIEAGTPAQGARPRPAG